MKRCWFCLEMVTLDDPDTYRQVTSWVNGPKLDGPVMREQSGLVAHKKCVDNLVNGQAPDQPGLFDEENDIDVVHIKDEVGRCKISTNGQGHFPCTEHTDFAHSQEGGDCAPESCGGTRHDPCGYTKIEMEHFRLRQIEPHVFEVMEGASGNSCTHMVLVDDFGEDCGYPADHSIHIKEG